MSLKAFHIFFIVVSILLSFGFSYWCFVKANDGAFVSLLGLIGVVSGLALIFYGRWFLRKSKAFGGSSQ